ncbi:GCN5-related N-acetyltransferase [Achromobacter insuavis AXX-A]|uniref:GCN5-related N-acetyltransferase n=3 Tax=Pseudomonadati TaxID=3379134 RepID=F7SYZ0_9BURK|nr:GCN5-related N-acetyltransferase [Achromobacter insuavis AXX-A]
MLPAPMIVAIRVDASVEIGAGHVMRCLTLADGLAAAGATVHFLCRPHAGHLGDLIERRGHVLHLLPAPEKVGPDAGVYGAWLGDTLAGDCRATGDVLSRLRPEWLVVDHYALDASWQKPLRQWARRILVIDDLADRDHDCDILLDQNFYRDAGQRYGTRVSSRCTQLLGPRYALLRPEFCSERAVPRGRDGQVRRVLVAFGGMDRDDYTSRFLAGLPASAQALEFDVVIGASHPRRAALSAFCDARPNVALHVQSSRMAELMQAADLAVGASGTSNWERFCVGVPTIAAAVAENQAPLLHDLMLEGALLGVALETPDAIGDCLRLFEYARHQPSLLRGLAEKGRRMVDGKGMARVLRRMLTPEIALRLVTAQDCRAIFEWRNDPRARAHAHDSSPLAFSSHARWFEAVLADPNRVMLIATTASESAAVVRFDCAGSSATISIYLVPDMHGRALGPAVIRQASDWLLAERPEIERVLAEVKPENQASAQAFGEAGYALQYQTFVLRRTSND